MAELSSDAAAATSAASTGVDAQTQALITAAVAAAVAATGAGAGALTRITVGDMVAKTIAGIRTDTIRTYKTYLLLLAHGWSSSVSDFTYPGIGHMWLDEVLPSHLESALDAVKVRAGERVAAYNDTRRALGRVELADSGTTPRYNAVGAYRRLFHDGIAERHLSKHSNPCEHVPKPTRTEGTRRALTQAQLDEMWEVIDSTGDDPELDRMLCETILVTGARVEGLLNLQLRYLDAGECVIWLDEKFGRVIAQPAPGWFIDKLIAFATERGATARTDRVFIKRAIGTRPAAAITDRRFDNLFGRIQAAFEWADRQQVTAHVLRHHAITVVERYSGSKAIARAFARHCAGDVNDIYTSATPREVAKVIVELYGGDHPWLHREPLIGKRPR